MSVIGHKPIETGIKGFEAGTELNKLLKGTERFQEKA